MMQGRLIFKRIQYTNMFSFARFITSSRTKITSANYKYQNRLINPCMPMFNFCTASTNQQMHSNATEYLRFRYKSIPQETNLELYENVSTQDIENYIKSNLMEKYGYSEEDIDYLLFFNQKIVLPSNYKEGGTIETTVKYFNDKFKMNHNEVRELVLHYPIYLRFNKEKLDERIKYSYDLGLCGEELTMDEIIDIFKANPFYFLSPIDNYNHHIGQFKKYGFTKQETIRMLKEVGGVMGLNRGSIDGIFDLVRKFLDVKASHFKEIILKYPEMLLQQRKHMLKEKIVMIRRNSNISNHYFRELFHRHPELFLKSYSSFRSKIRFLIVDMGRNLKMEEAFPMLLKYNFHQHIRPRCELAYEKNRDFNLTEVLTAPESEFGDALKKKKEQYPVLEEKDIMWRYVPVP